MVRVFWLAVIFLSSVFGIVAYKIGAAASARTHMTAIPLSVATADLADAALVKSDRLDAESPSAAKTVIHTIPIAVVPEITAAKSAPKPIQSEKTKTIISRHWHASYARMARRVDRQQPAPPPPQPEESHNGILSWLKIKSN